jgi:GT2 family glycosyltransferase
VQEQLIAWKYPSVQKDILIVVHNQLEYVKDCLDSIRRHTENYQLWVWNNNSDAETTEYLKSQQDIRLFSSETNQGFIKPNNAMIAEGVNPYVILLNSDTVVYPNWDTALTGWLQESPETAAVSYCGGILDDEMKGDQAKRGPDIDFCCGWCLCINRDTYNQFGLFDNNLEFAYGEDSDFSLRLRSAGRQIYALYSDNVYHYGGKTSKSLMTNDEQRKQMERTFAANHRYLKDRWESYLKRCKS